MDRIRRLRIGLAFAALGMTPTADAQVVERDTTVTGPRGRTIERRVVTERQGGVVRREVDINRPAGSYRSQATVVHGQRPGPSPHWGYPGGPDRYFRPGPPPPPFYPRPSGFFGIGLGAPLVNLVVGSPPPPPPPLVVYPEPIVVAQPPPVVVYNPPVRYAAPQPQTIVVDPVAEQIQRLSSKHDNSREDACNILGRLGDSRALPPLVERLKNDDDKDVRIAAAWALANIGDPGGLIVLERATTYDKNPHVRGAAVGAYRRLEASTAASATAAASSSTVIEGDPIIRSQPAPTQSAIEPPHETPPPPQPEPYLTQPRL